MTPWLPSAKGDLVDYSDRIDGLLKRFLFILRPPPEVPDKGGGAALFFGKRRNLAIELHFGSKIVDQTFNSHCWIILDGEIRFEVDSVIQQYTTLVEYT